MLKRINDGFWIDVNAIRAIKKYCSDRYWVYFKDNDVDKDLTSIGIDERSYYALCEFLSRNY